MVNFKGEEQNDLYFVQGRDKDPFTGGSNDTAVQFEKGTAKIWEKDEKGNDVITLETVPKKDSEKPEKLKSMTYKG